MQHTYYNNNSMINGKVYLKSVTKQCIIQEIKIFYLALWDCKVDKIYCFKAETVSSKGVE